MVRFCGYDCEHAEACEDVPGCMVFNPIHCKLQKKMVAKGGICQAPDL